MDRYEYKLKTEQIQKLIARKEYKAALQIVETLDWRKEKDVRILSAAAEVYVANKQYSDAIDLLVQAYELAPIGRRVIYRLTEVAILAGETEAAESYLEEFREVAPGDSGSYILEYKLARLKKAPLEERIQVLEKYQEQDFDEKWSYELAKLYEEAGRIDECVRLCDDIVLWFSLGKYVERALALKAKHAPLTASQQDRINNPEIYQERFNEVREEMNRENAAPSETEAETTDHTEAEAEKPSEKQPEADTAFRETDFDEEEQEPESEEEPEEAPEVEEPSTEDMSASEELSKTEDEEEPKGLRRVVARLFGIHEEELFGEDDLDDEDEEDFEEREDSPEEIVDAEPEDVTEPEEESEQEEEKPVFAEPILPEVPVVETEDDTSWISQMVEDTLQSADELEEQEEEEAEQKEEEAEQKSEKSEPEEKKETLEELLQDPSIRTAAETGDVFAATIREAEEEAPTEEEESDVLEGQLEFDFTRLSAIEKVKEEREKELGIWDDPFRYLTMQEPEEEERVRRILAGEEESFEQEEAEPATTDPFATRELQEVSEILSRIPDFTEESAQPEESTEEGSEESEVAVEEVTETEEAAETAETEEEGSFEAVTKAVEESVEEAEPEAESTAESESAEDEEAFEEPVESEPAEEILSVEEEETPVDAATEAEPETVTEEPEEQPELAEHGIIEMTDVEVEDMPMPEAEPEKNNDSPMDDIWRLLDEEEQALRRTEQEVQKALEEEPAFVLPDAVQPDAVARNAARKKKESEQAVTLETEPASVEAQPEPVEKTEEPQEELPVEKETPVEAEAAEPEAVEAEPEQCVEEEPKKAWSTHNIVVRSENMKAGFELAIGYLMRLPMEERLPSVAKTNGAKLNDKDWDDLEERLKDRILVIEQANSMDDATIQHLRRYLTEPDHMAVMIDTEENIAEIGLRNKPLLDMFPTEYAYYEYSVEEIVDHGVTYAAKKGWKLDDMALLAFSAAVEAVGEEQPGRELIEAENIMDDAIERAESGLFSGLFRKKEKTKILHENHFKQR
ncbi:MAG: hypothetical protein MR529_06745 [Cuneatibacter sp.]|nr:hypothetical protein [Cuneatibacter sp.]